jgi:uncharacterized protein (TIGR03435 family)
MSDRNSSQSVLFIAWAMLVVPYALAQGGAMAAPSTAPAASAAGQSGVPPMEAGTRAPVYDVVSVKPSEPDCAGMSIDAPAGHFRARCITVWGLLYNAYTVQSMHDYPPGLPDWAQTAVFDVEATAGDDTVAAMQELSAREHMDVGKQMLQALLADRFKLRVHYESRIQPIEQLVITKSGAKLKPWPEGQQSHGTSWGSGQIKIQGGGMDKLAFILSDALGRKVVDTTGLTGPFDIELKWTPDDRQGAPDAGPTLVTALEEQLGLKLEPAKGPVDTLVVDHVEKPSEN